MVEDFGQSKPSVESGNLYKGLSQKRFEPQSFQNSSNLFPQNTLSPNILNPPSPLNSVSASPAAGSPQNLEDPIKKFPWKFYLIFGIGVFVLIIIFLIFFLEVDSRGKNSSNSSPLLLDSYGLINVSILNLSCSDDFLSLDINVVGGDAALLEFLIYDSMSQISFFSDKLVPEGKVESFRFDISNSSIALDQAIVSVFVKDINGSFRSSYSASCFP